ncbi:unnamed protein product [Rotaria magnacalcarata]|uniref:Uncharacterized protein n=1 Tax=Rotaria magnacalcarata TaxID=392030 RepID=A0A816XFY8_9BILA|nr:unnamed protein product [Rotaria magnacalcarata]
MSSLSERSIKQVIDLELCICLLRIWCCTNLVVALFSVLKLVFGGFLGSNALFVNEFMGLTLCVSHNTSTYTKTGADALSELIADHGTSWDLWESGVALSVITADFLL